MPKQLIDFLAIKVTKKQEMESTVGGGKNQRKTQRKTRRKSRRKLKPTLIEIPDYQKQLKHKNSIPFEGAESSPVSFWQMVIDASGSSGRFRLAASPLSPPPISPSPAYHKVS